MLGPENGRPAALLFAVTDFCCRGCQRYFDAGVRVGRVAGLVPAVGAEYLPEM